MDKRRLHHLWTKTRWIKPRYFLILAGISLVVCIFALRANNQQMSKLRDAVYAADKNNTDVQAPLRDLQAYVTHHMNTSLSAGNTAVYPPIQLKYTYDRLTKSRGIGPGSQIYTDAQHHCEALNSYDFSGRNRVPCIESYVKAHTPAKPAAIPDALYKFAFVSPRWSPDLAGWTLALTVLSTFLFAVTFAAGSWLKRAVK